jgi:hypothetical protein
MVVEGGSKRIADAAFPSSSIDMWSKLVGYEMKIQCQDPEIIYSFNGIIREKDSSRRGADISLYDRLFERNRRADDTAPKADSAE